MMFMNIRRRFEVHHHVTFSENPPALLVLWTGQNLHDHFISPADSTGNSWFSMKVVKLDSNSKAVSCKEPSMDLYLARNINTP